MIRTIFKNTSFRIHTILKSPSRGDLGGLFLLLLLLSAFTISKAQKTPIMGWSSWNNFRINISEKMIREQADAMIASGLYDAGYRYINIDDGYFGGRDAKGNLFADKKKFPGGMKKLVDYIHAKKLKAGIYTDAGINTCGSYYDKDKKGIGSGIYGHSLDDCTLFFREWGFDFIKMDWCGGEKMELKPEETYPRIIDYIHNIDSAIVFNVCCWRFPGDWAIKRADSWRISSDIKAEFSSILKIIDLNADLSKYASAGHYNDMDMLQVGRGMTYDEDKSHFSMWCMLNSPLLAGNDLRKMTPQTIEILTNKELIALNQDAGFKQATRLSSTDDVDVWLKPLGINADAKAIAILNRSNAEKSYTFTAKSLNLKRSALLRDLWLHKDLGKIGKEQKFTIPAHGIVVLKIK